MGAIKEGFRRIRGEQSTNRIGYTRLQYSAADTLREVLVVPANTTVSFDQVHGFSHRPYCEMCLAVHG